MSAGYEMWSTLFWFQRFLLPAPFVWYRCACYLRFFVFIFLCICFFKENLKFIPEFVFLLSLIYIFANHRNSNFLAQFDSGNCGRLLTGWMHFLPNNKQSESRKANSEGNDANHENHVDWTSTCLDRPTDSWGKRCCILYMSSQMPLLKGTHSITAVQHKQLTSPNCSQLPPLHQNQRHCVTNFSALPPPAETSSLSSAYEHVDSRRTRVSHWQPSAWSPTVYTALNDSKCICTVTTCPACGNCNQHI